MGDRRVRTRVENPGADDPWVFQGLSSLFFFLRGARFLRASSFFLLSLNQRLLAVVYAVENVIKDATIGEVNL